MTNDYDGTTERRARKRRARGIGTVIACFAAAVVIAAILDDDDKKPRVNVAVAEDTVDNDATAAADGRTVFKINKGHVVVVPTAGTAQIDMDPELRAHAKITVNGKRTVIKVDDEFSDDDEIRIAVPKDAACRIELSAGLLEVEGLPCTENDLIVRSGKMDVSDVPKLHGKLSGSVSVGTVRIDGGEGHDSKSSGIGDLRAEVPGTGAGPTLTARVDVGMLTVDVE